MELYLLDWLNLLLRWAHVIVSIAWIGSSFYFVFLDNSLVKPTDPDLRAKGVDGEIWAVHGGGFYNPQKYMVAPKTLPEKLHWFFWESYSTWLTGFALFTVLYLFNAESFLIDRRVLDWSPAAATTTALALLAGFWIAYDSICRLFTGRVQGERIIGVLVTVLVVCAAWLTCQLFSGRAAFLLTGAMMATAMSANVLIWIIPGQRTVIAQMKAGQRVDPIHGQRGKQRSVHNTYFTLPVLIAMLSNHYGWLYQGTSNWLVLVGLMLAGALIRHSFVIRHKALATGQPVRWRAALIGTILIGLIVTAVGLRDGRFATPPASGALGTGTASSLGTIELTEPNLRQVIDQRCVACHNAGLAQKNVALHTPELLNRHAQAVYQQVVVTRQMPLNNATGLTEAERDLVKRWFDTIRQNRSGR
ncbi:MAG: hypothetical protein RL322_299 [Pseudomonadota bacterium]|jgi:uncharacterized membrane protein